MAIFIVEGAVVKREIRYLHTAPVFWLHSESRFIFDVICMKALRFSGQRNESPVENYSRRNCEEITCTKGEYKTMNPIVWFTSSGSKDWGKCLHITVQFRFLEPKVISLDWLQCKFTSDMCNLRIITQIRTESVFSLGFLKQIFNSVWCWRNWNFSAVKEHNYKNLCTTEKTEHGCLKLCKVYGS